MINPGDFYIELMDSAPAYQSGTRHSLACAEEFIGVDIELEKVARFG